MHNIDPLDKKLCKKISIKADYIPVQPDYPAF